MPPTRNAFDLINIVRGTVMNRIFNTHEKRKERDLCMFSSTFGCEDSFSRLVSVLRAMPATAVTTMDAFGLNVAVDNSSADDL